MMDFYDDCEEEEKKARCKWDKVRLRNLKVNFAKKMVESSADQKRSFSLSELKEVFAFKEYDIKYLANAIFDKKKDDYYINDEFKVFIDNVIKSNTLVQPYLADAETSFIRIYGVFHDEIKRNLYTSYSYGKYSEMFGHVKEILPIIHWGRLPIFNRYLLYNRELSPETETVEFYNHPDCLNALLSEVRNEGLVLTNTSDNTLNRKMNFNVYTRRWGHTDSYTITRTVDGWYCGYMSINGDCKKDGNGGLFSNLDHDLVFYPKEGVEYALRNLWDAADDGEIDFNELAKRLQEVADWISAVEKSISAQPEWVHYY